MCLLFAKNAVAGKLAGWVTDTPPSGVPAFIEKLVYVRCFRIRNFEIKNIKNDEREHSANIKVRGH